MCEVFPIAWLLDPLPLCDGAGGEKARVCGQTIGFRFRFAGKGDIGAEVVVERAGMGAERIRVAARRNQGEEDGLAALAVAGYFELQPLAKAGIVDLGAAMPELRGKRALDAEIVEAELDSGLKHAEVTHRVGIANVQHNPREFVLMNFDQHDSPSPGPRLAADNSSNVPQRHVCEGRVNQGVELSGFELGARTRVSAVRPMRRRPVTPSRVNAWLTAGKVIGRHALWTIT